MRILLLLAALLPVSVLGAQAPASRPAPGSLTFETPPASLAAWSVTPPGSVVADDAVRRSGTWSARVTRPAGADGGFSGMTQLVPLDVAGKTITVRGYLKTQDVTGSVAMWARIDGATPNLAFATSQTRGVRGTQDWHVHEVSVPVVAAGDQLFFGVFVAGAGTAWVDDIEVVVDGVPIWDAPKAARPETAQTRDREFDAGSTVALETLSPVQIGNLATLGKVWGFLKYHHPAVTSGSRHWDYDLFRVLPQILDASNRASANAAMSRWVTSLGPVPPCGPCAALNDDAIHLRPDVRWIEDTNLLGPDLSRQLRGVHANRPASATQHFLTLTPGVRNPVFQNEPDYRAVTLPDPGFQLLAVYRFWNIIQYWFPYRDVIGEDWNDVLGDVIPKVATAKTPVDYQQQMMALIARVHDTHANLWSSLASRPPMGVCQVPAGIRFVAGRPVVWHAGGDLQRGDVITSIDDVPVARLVEQWRPYYAASNEPTRLRDIAMSITRGACGQFVLDVERAGKPLRVETTRVALTSAPAIPRTHDLPGDTFRLLSDEVAYLKLSTIKGADVAGYVKAAAGTKGLVVDIRNYPSEFVVFTLGQLLAADVTPFALFTRGDLASPGAFLWSPGTTLKPAGSRYPGKIVILVDEVSQSQAEYTAMALRTASGAKVIGSTTAGADGNVSAIPLPGGLRSMISGIGVFYPDKRPTQRIGIVPDIEVLPTVEGIRAGRDEVLEAALREILGPAVPLAAIQKLIGGPPIPGR